MNVGIRIALVDDQALVRAGLRALLEQQGIAIAFDVASHSDGAKHDADNAALIARLRVSPEGQEGLSAFLDKRKPAWIAE